MAVRIRKNGQIFCAAMTESKVDDIYLDDNIHYILSVENKVLVTDNNHLKHGEWWWKHNIPKNINISKFYYD